MLLGLKIYIEGSDYNIKDSTLGGAIQGYRLQRKIKFSIMVETVEIESTSKSFA